MAATQRFLVMRSTITAPGLPEGVRPQTETSFPLNATKGNRKASSEYFAWPFAVKNPDC
jgi:hypothetical protein